MLDQPREVSTQQINSLAKALRRSRTAIKTAVEEARENFAENAQRYVDIHKAATEAALESGDNETALKGSQWAIEHVSLDGARVTEKERDVSTGSRIMIGIKVGGIDPPAAPAAIDVPVSTE